MLNISNRGRFAFIVVVISLAAGIYLSSVGLTPNAQNVHPDQIKVRFDDYARSDEVTAAIRKKDNRILRIRVENSADRDRANSFGKTISDMGSFVVVSASRNVRPGELELDHQTLETSVNVPAGVFEPLSDLRREAMPTGKSGYYIVQFGGPVTDEWLDSIRDAGVEVIQYVPHHAFYVYGDGEAISRVAAHSRVRWIGEFTKDHKISPALREYSDTVKADTAMFDIAVFSRADLGAVQHKIAALGAKRFNGRLALPNTFFGVIRAELPISALDRIAAIPDVIRIDPFIKPQAEDERAAQIVAGNYTGTTSITPPGYDPLAQFGADGTGVTVMVSDDGVSIPGNGGLYITPANAVDAPLRGAPAGAGGGHGHLNASIIAGAAPFGALDPLGYNYGLGIAPKANIINVPFLRSGYPSDVTSDALAVDDALNTLGPNGVRGTISNNSWGSGLNNNSYDSFAATYDALVRDGSAAASIDPFNIIFSAGNSGPGALTLTRPKVSKNTIAVANSENLRTEFGGTNANNIDDLRGSSSRGPTADGRIKPDITAPGTYISGGRAGNCTQVGSCFDEHHAWSTGTSHAAPQVAGMAALFTNFWKNTHAGQYPLPSLVKAAILSTGQDMNGLTTNTSTIPNGIEGWGRVNTKMMLNTGVPMKYVNEEVLLSQPGSAYTLMGSVADPGKPVRVALVWTDPPAASDPALVNDLDLEVSVGGVSYKGNVFGGGISVVGGIADTKNNVEMVFLPDGISAGTPFTIKVSAAALNGDGVLGNADGTDQGFAIVAYNFGPEPAVAFWSVAGRVMSGDGRGVSNASVRLINSEGNAVLAVTNPFGYFTFLNVPGGQSYTATVAARRLTFQTQNISVNQDVTGLTFTPIP